MSILQQIADSLTRQFRAYETRRSLSRLSDRSLADLGVSRELIDGIAAMAASRGTVSLSDVRAMADQEILVRRTHAPVPSAPSPLAALLGTPKSVRLATTD